MSRPRWGASSKWSNRQETCSDVERCEGEPAMVNLSLEFLNNSESRSRDTRRDDPSRCYGGRIILKDAPPITLAFYLGAVVFADLVHRTGARICRSDPTGRAGFHGS